MAKAERTSKCSKWAHKWNQVICSVCSEEHPDAKRQRAWNSMMARIVAAGPDAYGTVPPPPDYSTAEAVQDRALERCSVWYRDFVRLGRQDGRTYRAFRRAVERTGATMALPFPAPVVEALRMVA